jgi:hypothetical protein
MLLPQEDKKAIKQQIMKISKILFKTGLRFIGKLCAVSQSVTTGVTKEAPPITYHFHATSL